MPCKGCGNDCKCTAAKCGDKCTCGDGCKCYIKEEHQHGEAGKCQAGCEPGQQAKK